MESKMLRSLKTYKNYLVVFALFTATAYFFFVAKNQFRDLKLSTSSWNQTKREENCGRFPEKNDIKIDNEIWQVLETSKGTFALLNAYFDDREDLNVVRISLIGENLNITVDKIHCQFWTDDKSETKPFVVEASSYLPMLPETHEKVEDKMLSFLITCPVSFDEIPVSVSLTGNRCENASNKLKVIDNQPSNETKKKSFGVCTSSLTIEDKASVSRFIEWMEMLRILGASKISSFNKKIEHGLKVIEFFQNKNFLDLNSWQDPSVLRLAPKNSILETMQLTDCFYRSKNLYEYLIVLNPEEILIPMRSEDRTWKDLAKNFKKSDRIASYMSLNMVFPNTGFVDNAEIPSHHYMLQHTDRFSGTNGLVKSFINTDEAVTLYEHFAQFCLGSEWCNFETLDSDVSLVFHFKTNEMSNSTVEDTTLLKYRDGLISAVSRTLNVTGFQP